MESPVFRLEGVLKEKNVMVDFEGPLALILQFLSKDKIEIRDISISQILEQYLEYLDRMAELDLDIASEFVAMASHLTYIKTKMLLSGDEEISELEQLISSLEELRHGDLYIQVRFAADLLSGMYSRGSVVMPGPPEYLPQDTEYKYVHDGTDLFEAVSRVIGRENVLISSMNPREAVYPRRIVFSIPEKITGILEKLRQIRKISAATLFYECRSRAELIATLIAVLELCRIGNVLLTGALDDIMIVYSGTGKKPADADYIDYNEGHDSQPGGD